MKSKSSPTFVRSVRHTLNVCNAGKLLIISDFLNHYRYLTQFYIGCIWNDTIKDGYGNTVFNIKDDKLNLPTYINYKNYSPKTKLSARIQSASIDAACGIIRSRIEMRKRSLYMRDKLKAENRSYAHLEKNLNGKLVLHKPELKDDFKAELSSKNIDIKYSDNTNSFDIFVRLKSTGYKHLIIPVSFDKRDCKCKDINKGKLLTGILLSNKYIELRYEIPTLALKTTGDIVGVDTGIKDIAVFSDKQITPKHKIHSLESIMNDLKRKKKGSRGYARKQEHRKNFINWSLNQLNVKHIKELKVEKISNHMPNRWVHGLIDRKLQKISEENGVRFSSEPSTYFSQRCSGCGIVRKSHRKNKVYKCKSCNLEIDADYNSAMNHEKNLYQLPWNIRCLKINIKGFLWKEDGIYDLNGQELVVPDTKTK